MKDRFYDNPILAKKFNPETWDGDKFQKDAGLKEMYQRINSMNPTLVIDAGCGRNIHKNHIKNLIGFDPSPFPGIDFKATILEAEFEKESADAVLALGSVQFIDRDYIYENMDKIFSWVKPHGIIEMRVATEQFASRRIGHFFWTEDMIDYLTEKYDLSFYIKPVIYDSYAYGLRRKWTWKKSIK